MIYPVKYTETSFNLPHDWLPGVSHHAISYQGTEEVLIGVGEHDVHYGVLVGTYINLQLFGSCGLKIICSSDG